MSVSETRWLVMVQQHGAELGGDSIGKSPPHGDSDHPKLKLWSSWSPLPTQTIACLAFLLSSFDEQLQSFKPQFKYVLQKGFPCSYSQAGLSALPWYLLDIFRYHSTTAPLCLGPSAFAQSPSAKCMDFGTKKGLD